MIENSYNPLPSAIFITFSGNCKKALTFYQTCFGGRLQFDTFEGELNGYITQPVVSGSLVAQQLTIYGSDLVPSEGRKVGNFMAIVLHCENNTARETLIKKLVNTKNNSALNLHNQQKLIEIVDNFGVRWILSSVN